MLAALFMLPLFAHFAQAQNTFPANAAVELFHDIKGNTNARTSKKFHIFSNTGSTNGSYIALNSENEQWTPGSMHLVGYLTDPNDLGSLDDVGISFATKITSSWTPSGNDPIYKENMVIQKDGRVRVGVNSIPAGYTFAVGGKAICEGMRIVLKGSSEWPDYVFDEDYQLQPLSEVESFIKANSHLPNVPSVKEVEAEGIGVAEMDATLLRKIEELTLYTLEQQKQIEEMQAALKTLNAAPSNENK